MQINNRKLKIARQPQPASADAAQFVCEVFTIVPAAQFAFCNFFQFSIFNFHYILLVILIALSSTGRAFAQQARPSKPPESSPPRAEEQEPVRIFTEEVRLPVAAFDEYGHYDPTLEADDILVLEDGVPQQIRSVRHVPANVLLLLDTSNQLGFVKGVNLTREVALQVVSHLPEDDYVSVIQFNDRVELLQDWTTDTDQTKRVLKTKLFSGRRESLAEGIAAAVGQLKDRPAGNRHVVLVTDGVETGPSGTKLEEAIRQLNAAQATVYVISYTALMRRAIERRLRRATTQAGTGVPKETNPAGDPTMPPGQTRNPSYKLGGITFDLDRELRRRRKAYIEATKRSEGQLGSLAGETGGQMFLPVSTDEMIRQGNEVARDIGAEYVITYRPSRPLSAARPGEYRRIDLAPRRIGLTLRSRRGYVVP